MLKAAYIVPHPPILLPEIGKKEEEKSVSQGKAMKRLQKISPVFVHKQS